MLAKRVLCLLLLIFAFDLLSDARAAEPVAVIVNSENTAGGMDPGEIRKMYTNNTLIWPDGSPVILYDLLIENRLREVFSSRILGKDPERVAEEWAHLKITNQAKNPPVTMKSEALIIKRVASERGAIGYVSLSAVRNNPRVRVVFTIE
jgi:ABC-type phosphate transport system substrate-binding protein